MKSVQQEIPKQKQQKQKGEKQQQKQKAGKQQNGNEKKDEKTAKTDNGEKKELSAKELKALKKQEKHDKKAARLAGNAAQTQACGAPHVSFEIRLGEVSELPSIPVISNIHHSFAQFALQSANYKCMGSTVRALRFIECIIETIKASNHTQSSECVGLVEENVKMLEKARHITVGMNNINKFIFLKNQCIADTVDTAQKIAMGIIGSQDEIVTSSVLLLHNESILTNSGRGV